MITPLLQRITQFSALLMVLSATHTWSEESTPPREPTYRIERDQVFARPAGYRLRADMFLPNSAGPHPGLLLIHGGGWMGGSKVQMKWHATRLVANGYVVMSINYRLAPQYKFPAQIEDCRAALVWLCEQAKQFDLDVQRLGAVGYSAGGQLACLLNVEPAAAPHRLKAVVAGGAPCDFMVVPPDSPFLAYWLNGTRSEQPQNYYAASPVHFVTADDSPTFFFHGTKDRVVPLFSSRCLLHRLSAVGVETQLHLCNDKGHVRTFIDQSAFEGYLTFLDRHLKTPDQHQTGNVPSTREQGT